MQKSRRTTRQCVNGFSLFDARYVTIERHHISDEQRRKFYFRTASPIIGIATARRARRFAIVFTFFFFFRAAVSQSERIRAEDYQAQIVRAIRNTTWLDARPSTNRSNEPYVSSQQSHYEGTICFFFLLVHSPNVEISNNETSLRTLTSAGI